jgi:Transcription factor WhiB
MRVAAELEWQTRSVCYLETSDAPEMWTSDRRPQRLLRKELQRMCARCPVRAQCAADAVLTDAEAGTYAGVYLPQNIAANSARRAVAMDELRAVAELPPAEEDLAYLGVSA